MTTTTDPLLILEEKVIRLSVTIETLNTSLIRSPCLYGQIFVGGRIMGFPTVERNRVLLEPIPFSDRMG